MGIFRKIVGLLFLLEAAACFYLANVLGSSEVRDYLSSTFRGEPMLREAIEQMMDHFKSVFQFICAISLAGGIGAFKGVGWGRLIALVSSVANLVFFFPLGVAGLVAFWKKDPAELAAEANKAEEPADAGLHSLITIVASGVHFGLALFLSSWLKDYLKLEWYFRQERIEGISFPLLLSCFFLFTMLHEVGHLLMAWATGFRFLAINIGPLTVEKDLDGNRRFRWNLAGLFVGGGYVSAIPKTAKDLRSNWLFVVLAGPAFSLLFALIAFQLLLTQGAEGLGEWTQVVLLSCSVCFADAVANMLPLGRLDGGQFFSVAFNTDDGKALLATLEGAMNQGTAHDARRSEDWTKSVEAEQQALAAMERAGKEDSAARVASLLHLGEALLRTGEPSKALDAFEKALSSANKISLREPSLLASIHMGLSDAARLTGQAGVAAAHTNDALSQLEAYRENTASWSSYAEIGVLAAKLRLLQRDYYEALEEVGKSFQLANKSLKVSQKLELLTVQTEALAALGRLPAAMEIWKELQEDFLNPAKRQRNSAENLFALSQMADTAWRYGAEEWAIATLGETCKSDALGPAKTAQLRIQLAGWLAMLGRAEEALQALHLTEEQKAALTDDWRRRAELALGDAFLEANQGAQAQLAFSRAAQLPVRARSKEEEAAEEGLQAEAQWLAGQEELAMETAKRVLDVLMPLESVQACRTLLVYALGVGAQSPGDEEMFFQEMVRLTADKTKGTVAERARLLAKVSRRLRQLGKTQFCEVLEAAETDLRRQIQLPLPTAHELEDEPVIDPDQGASSMAMSETNPQAQG